MENENGSVKNEAPILEMTPHTKVKHVILRTYLQAWFPIMSRYNRKLVYIDGFSGSGIYDDNSEGSPIIALSCLIEHKLSSQMLNGSQEFVFFLIEKDKASAECLKGQISTRFPRVPGCVKVHLENADFEMTMNDALDTIDKNGSCLAPTFAFIDPFGFKGMSMTTMGRVMANPKCELMINFMSGFINRFVNASDADKRGFTKLFGSDGWKNVQSIQDIEMRREFLITLYKTQLKEQAHVKYVRTFEMRGDKNQLIYDLIFATNSIKGLEAMKEAMWKADPQGRYQFCDTTNPRQTSLIQFTDDVYWIPDAAQAVCDQFKGTVTSLGQVEEFVVASTPFLFRKRILNHLKGEGKITCIQNSGGKRGFPDGCRLAFSS